MGSSGAIPDDGADVAATLEAIRLAVVRSAGYASRADVPPLAATSPVSEAADLARVSAHLPVTWTTPIAGRTLSLVKRATRIGLRWYINPIVEQQNAFNEAVVRALASLEARQQELERQLAERDAPDRAE